VLALYVLVAFGFSVWFIRRLATQRRLRDELPAQPVTFGFDPALVDTVDGSRVFQLSDDTQRLFCELEDAHKALDQTLELHRMGDKLTRQMRAAIVARREQETKAKQS